MRPLFIRLLSLLLAYSAIPVSAQNKEIIGYYPSWKLKSGPNPLTPAKIPYQKLTMINFAFLYPLPDGTLDGRDSIGDDFILNGEPDHTTGGRKPGTSLVELAHKNGVKVMLSVGGWADSYNFPAIAANESTRARFASACAGQIRVHGFDGIDIDWEFPCLDYHQGTPNDRSNYTTLLQTLRDTLDACGKLSGNRYYLTAALPAGETFARNFEMEKVFGLLDMLNVMTYDFNGEWDSLSGYNSPLYAPNASDPSRNVDAAFNLYATTYHVPASKINLGVPFYGHTYSDCTSLYAHHKGTDTVHFSTHGCFYYDVVAIRDSLTRKWDSNAKVPYLVSTTWNTLISYDDEESIGYKAQYVIDKNARGLIIWEITGDYLADGTTPLLDVINSKFRGARLH